MSKTEKNQIYECRKQINDYLRLKMEMVSDCLNRRERLLQDSRNILKLDRGKDYTLSTKLGICKFIMRKAVFISSL